MLVFLRPILGGFPEEGTCHRIARSGSHCLKDQFDSGFLTDLVGLGCFTAFLASACRMYDPPRVKPIFDSCYHGNH